MLISNRFLKMLFVILNLFILLFLILPIISTIIISFNPEASLSFPIKDYSITWYLNYFSNEQWLMATAYSFRIAFFTALSTTTLGIVTAVYLVKTEFKYKNVLYILFLTPMVVPPMVLSIALYFFFAKVKFISGITPIVIGHTILALPIVLITISTTLQGISPNLERAAVSLGASGTRAFINIIMPLITPSIITGLLFSFLLSFDELLIPMFLGGVEIMTLPTKIWGSLTYSMDPTVAAVSSLIIITIVTLLVISQLVFRRRKKA